MALQMMLKRQNKNKKKLSLRAKRLCEIMQRNTKRRSKKKER